MAVECIETHISWVFRTDTEVFKVKRPVAFPFLDFSSPALRAQACSDEVALNARLAPGVYRGVVPVRRTADGMHHVGGEVGEVVDHAVCMTRLQDTSRADVLLETGALDGPAIDRLAAHLAQFHRTARADSATAAHGSIEDDVQPACLRQ